MTAPAPARAAVSTLVTIDLPDPVRDALGGRLAELPGPGRDIDWLMTRYLQIFAQLPTPTLQQLLDFGRHSDTPGVGYVRNAPVDPWLPDTPRDGGPCPDKSTFVAEGVLLGLSGLLGEPVGFATEKNGQLVHDVVPVPGGAMTQTNQGSSVFLNFHNDIVHDESGRYDLAGPDFLVLSCLRADHEEIAGTYYADARDICRALDPATLEILRSPLFRMNAPGSYVREVAGGGEVLSDPVPMISGPESCPEVSAAANGIRALDGRARAALDRLQEACREVAHEVFLRPGQALLINNRKGLHARSSFTARYDGRDRWLQRTYVRRSQWTIRHRATPGSRRLH
ncbi:TauD/TfdA family dioxygenase (plasmid) [Streptomyces sp. NBC_01591]|uniref:TauD/TfdA family dioxygenase n=1 Tax=Streptomyces sp. NBC_01591 TaxID=2975888 RepID=UPI002DDA40B2|nr:TauD/TfdA family dioxygenase [Streptomyces sp. NBC_01591]WSD73884.1 TauD/TfdA family dioxygenase [Streptomyces sp. NBC_01591]